MIAEAQAAERWGWDFYGPGEQHFYKKVATNSSPEITLAAIAAKTERLRLRPLATNFLPFNHPIRIAEQMATLDAISDGRTEIAGARSNNPYTLETFGIPASETAAHRDETIEILIKSLSSDEFEHHGALYDIPKASISPGPVQTPPPISIASTGVASHLRAGKTGIGVMTGSSILGWEYAQEMFDAYRAGMAEAEPIAGYVNNCITFSSVGVYCAASRDEAKEIARPVALMFVDAVLEITSMLAKKSDDYAYMARTESLQGHATDLDYLIDDSPYLTIGTPDDFIARAEKMHAMGADEILFRLDGYGHENNLRALELIGKEVIPSLHALPPHPGSTPAPGSTTTN
jgi:alkanesulfonate monooxygenase SsuD/methylene tetrahydromethanopterin reductase-like flavin-dependent oxidoreductase (luciferase family)